MHEYYEKQTEPVADPPDHASPPATPNTCAHHDIIDRVRSKAAAAPDSPSAVIALAQESTYLLERADARIAIQGVHIRELQNAEPGRSKQGDKCQLPGQTSVKRGIEGIGTKPVEVEAEALRDIGNELVSDEDSDEEQPSSASDEGSLSSELVDAFDGEPPQIISDPSEDKLGEKENDRRTAGCKQRAEEPMEDDVGRRPKWRIVRPDRLKL
ncbi:hypothetical protein C8R45DRAFT_931795 [Mycena sanguinolenta]|nr:hypothetical protein C8R45DRAFT_931795 [Mycena sanguinolenta]